MYTVEPDFDSILTKHTGLLKNMTSKLISQSKFHNATFEDIYAMVQVAAWKAWLAQKKQAASNGGQSPYAFGTYLTWHVVLILRDYKELDSSFYHNEVNIDDIKRDATTKTNYEVYELLDHLDETQRQVIVLRFFDNLTLQECSKILDKSIEGIRQIQERALTRLRTYATKS